MEREVMLEVRERRSRFGGAVRWLFWGWQALFLAWGALILLALILDEMRPGAADAFGFAIALIPVLVPSWLPVTAVLGLLYLLTLRGKGRGQG